MNYLSPTRDRSPELPALGSPVGPAADANTRETITWLMHVQYHGGIASTESASALRALAHTLPSDANADALNPNLISVVESIRAFADTAIYDPHLADRAGTAIDRLTAKLSSPVKIVSPSKKATTSQFPISSNAVRKLDFSQFE